MSQSVTDDSVDSESAVFALAYSRGFPQTISFLVGKGVSFALAEELAQVAWARGWEARRQLRLADSVTAWINTIAYRRLCNHQRRLDRSVALTEHQDLRVLEPSLMLDAELLLSLCSPLDRVLLQQRYVDGMNLREIATTQGLSEMAVRLRLHRCRHGLRTIVSAGASRDGSVRARAQPVSSRGEGGAASSPLGRAHRAAAPFDPTLLTVRR